MRWRFTFADDQVSRIMLFNENDYVNIVTT